MKLNRLYTLVILITIVFSSSVNTFSQDDKILLCEVDMHIGMVWEEVIPVIASKCFYYTKFKDSKIYTLWDTADKQMVLGVVAFDSNNRLNYVSKKWFNPRRDECIDAWNILYLLLGKYQFDNHLNANPSELSRSEDKSKFIEFFIGRRNITVNFNENEIVDIDESLR